MLELGIFVSHWIWLFRTRAIRKEAATRGKTFDDVAAEYEEQGIEFEFAERRRKKKRKGTSPDIELDYVEEQRKQTGQCMTAP